MLSHPIKIDHFSCNLVNFMIFNNNIDMSNICGNSFLKSQDIFEYMLIFAKPIFQRTKVAIMRDTFGLFSSWAVLKTTAEHENKGLKNYQ